MCKIFLEIFQNMLPKSKDCKVSHSNLAFYLYLHPHASCPSLPSVFDLFSSFFPQLHNFILFLGNIEHNTVALTSSYKVFPAHTVTFCSTLKHDASLESPLFCVL